MAEQPEINSSKDGWETEVAKDVSADWETEVAKDVSADWETEVAKDVSADWDAEEKVVVDNDVVSDSE
ncbi:hypothetical protein ACIBKX_33850 [Streptomyces sp. NPDC050658]|uniref:hypothetical protein n=1 Tax=Streptomyces sp. NPDC050658 TaxID=3365633 RepID=UPI00379110C6